MSDYEIADRKDSRALTEWAPLSECPVLMASGLIKRLSQSPSSSRSRVMVPKVFTCLLTRPRPSQRRTHATTVCLWTSLPGPPTLYRGERGRPRQ